MVPLRGLLARSGRILKLCSLCARWRVAAYCYIRDDDDVYWGKDFLILRFCLELGPMLFCLC